MSCAPLMNPPKQRHTRAAQAGRPSEIYARVADPPWCPCCHLFLLPDFLIFCWCASRFAAASIAMSLAQPTCLNYHAGSDLLFCGCRDGNVLAWKLRGSNPPQLNSIGTGVTDLVSPSHTFAQSLESDAPAEEALLFPGTVLHSLALDDTFFHRTENMIHVRTVHVYDMVVR